MNDKHALLRANPEVCNLKNSLLQYLEFLLDKQSNVQKKRIPVFGSAKGTFKMKACN
jgi:hypothetical protein